MTTTLSIAAYPPATTRSHSERPATHSRPLTHEFVGQMVGSPGSAVTAAAAELRARKIIEYGRGTVIIKSVKRLHNSACDCVDAVPVLSPE